MGKAWSLVDVLFFKFPADIVLVVWLDALDFFKGEYFFQFLFYVVYYFEFVLPFPSHQIL